MNDEPQGYLEHPACCTACGADLPVIAEQRQVISDLEIELRTKRSIISRLQKDRNDRREADPFAKQAEEIFEFWRGKLCPRAKEFTGARFDAVVARLRAGRSVEELQRAVDGCANRQYVGDGGRRTTGKPSDRQVELELICRSDANVLRFMSYAEEDTMGPEIPAMDPLLAEACACGHPRVDHMKPAYNEYGLDVCGHPSCECMGFDNLDRVANDWLDQRNGRKKR